MKLKIGGLYMFKNEEKEMLLFIPIEKLAKGEYNVMKIWSSYHTKNQFSIIASRYAFYIQDMIMKNPFKFSLEEVLGD